MLFKVGDKVLLRPTCTDDQLDKIYIRSSYYPRLRNVEGQVERRYRDHQEDKDRIFVRFPEAFLWFHDHMLKRSCIWCDNTHEIDGKACPRCS